MKIKLNSDEKVLLDVGNLVAAVRMLRERTGCPLKEAVELSRDYQNGLKPKSKQKVGLINSTPMNERPFEHEGPNGTRITASRCDFAEGYYLHRPESITEEEFAHDIALIFHWHALNIAPELNGYNFGGGNVCKAIYWK
jgi:hypothetical protein